MDRRAFIPAALASLAGALLGCRVRPNKAERLSVDPSDPGYAQWSCEWSEGWTHTVFCDGAEVPLCVTADSGLGYAIGYVPSPKNGQAYFDPERNALPRQVYRGKIVIRRTRL